MMLILRISHLYAVIINNCYSEKFIFLNSLSEKCKAFYSLYYNFCSTVYTLNEMSRSHIIRVYFIKFNSKSQKFLSV
jgi:hypothetical protein